MITASQAKEQTLERLNLTAKEFITNIVEVAIQDAIDEGKFSTTVSLSGLSSGIRMHPESFGEAITALLIESGFEADHIYNKNLGGDDNYIFISWEKA